jgi:small subunit ribosomal protein S20
VATHKSAEKRARQDAKRRERNRTVRTRARSVVREVRAEIDAGASDLVSKLREAESALRRAAAKGVIPKRRASRLVSRLAKRVARATK